MFCDTCEMCRRDIRQLLAAPWDYVISHYEFMIVFTAYRRNMTFYSNMDLGQLKTMYAQLVSYSPARILVIDKLASTYKAQHRHAAELVRPTVPCTLSDVITLALGNRVPKRFVHVCIAQCNFLSYDNMTLASFASVEGIRGGALRYMAVLQSQGEQGRRDLHVIISTAITGWMMRLAGLECTCGTWAQVMDMVSCSTADTETSLTLQSEARVTAYICTLLDLHADDLPQGDTQGDSRRRQQQRAKVDYDYVFDELLVSGLSADDRTHRQLSAA